MAAPTFVTSVDTSTWAQAFAGALTLAVTTQVGDLLVVFGTMHGTLDALTISDTATNTWTQRVDYAPGSSYQEVFVWTATAATAASITISVARSGANGVPFGATVHQWRSHGGYGGLANASATAAAPSVNLTTTADNSAISMFVGDRAGTALTSQTYRTGAGTFTQRTAVVATNNDTSSVEGLIYHGYHADASAAGSKTIGMTVPSSQTYAVVGVEVLGSGGGSTVAMANRHPIAGVI